MRKFELIGFNSDVPETQVVWKVEAENELEAQAKFYENFNGSYQVIECVECSSLVEWLTLFVLLVVVAGAVFLAVTGILGLGGES